MAGGNIQSASRSVLWTYKHEGRTKGESDEKKEKEHWFCAHSQNGYPSFISRNIIPHILKAYCYFFEEKSMKKLMTICAVVIFVMAMSAGATTINYTVSGWGPNQYPASITPPANAPWGVDGYPGDTLEMVTYTGTLDLTPGTYNLKINTLNWTIDYTYGGTATNPDDWSNVFHNITAIRSISFDGGPSGSLSQTALLENQWANDFLTIDEGATSSFTVGGFQVNVTPLGLDQFGGTNFDGSNPWVQPQTRHYSKIRCCCPSRRRCACLVLVRWLC